VANYVGAATMDEGAMEKLDEGAMEKCRWFVVVLYL
jgi:hypothetical protein